MSDRTNDNGSIIPVILTDAPLPTKRKGGRPHMVQWAFLYELDPGQSAHFKFDSIEAMKKFRSHASSAVSRYAKGIDKKFSVRSVPQDEEGMFGIGIWRTDSTPNAGVATVSATHDDIEEEDDDANIEWAT